MNLRFSHALVAILFICASQVDAQTTVDFDDLTTGAKYYVGQAFQSRGTAITVDALSPPGGGAFCTITRNGYAWGSGNEVWTGNVMLHFGFPSASQISLLFGAYGGYTKVEVNGDTRQIGNLLSLNGIQIGGVDAYVTQSAPSGNVHGCLTLSGPINSFAIGGQEFAFDNVIAVPEPSCALSILGALGAMACVGQSRRRCR